MSRQRNESTSDHAEAAMLPIANSTYFHNLLDSFSAGMVILNFKGLVYASNTAASLLLGFGPEELTDPALAGPLIARTDNPRAVAHFLAAPLKHARKPDAITVRYQHPDGAPRNFRLSGSLLWENEKIFGILLEIDDVTEIFRLHDRERTMLLGIHAAQQERIESLGRFSLAVAHQIRNPLMVIGGFTSRLLKRRPPEDPEAAALSMILDGARRLEDVVRAVSAYARPRAPAPGLADPADLTARAMKLARNRTGMDARFALDAGIGRIRVDAELLVETLTELAANALEASGAPAADTAAANRTAITVTFRRGSGELRIAVADQGPGLPEDIRPFVFDPFFTTKAVGVGMGLPIAKRNAEALGGRLALTAGASGGCLAVLTLPDAPSGSAPESARMAQPAILP